MSVETVKSYFRRYGMEERIKEFETSSTTVGLAARALGYEPARIAKSLSFKAGDTHLLVITAGDAKIDKNSLFQSLRNTLFSKNGLMSVRIGKKKQNKKE